MRTRIIGSEDGYYAKLECDCPYTGQRRVREFYVPCGGGYVREYTSDNRNPQVCEMLCGSGNTLEWNPERKGPLVKLIRSEWRRFQAAERREQARDLCY